MTEKARSRASTRPLRKPLSIGFLEPHLRPVGGIRRILELSNRLVRRGHETLIFVADPEEASCSWMRCLAPVRPLEGAVDSPLDAIVFNHEPDWHLLSAFPRARARVFYALAAGWLYGKEGSWEAARADVDLVLANSSFTAEMIEKETGNRPAVVLGGLTHEYFRPLDVKKRYPILCVGDRRAWKGTNVIEEAAAILQLPLEKYAPKRLPQDRLAEEYCRAEVFAVGSPVEGFGWPGLEALACGVPLVTTDNGGCREYAIHEETALVVPPNDPEAMADAIDRIRRDGELASSLKRNGLALAHEKFDWERATDEFNQHLEATVERGRRRPSPCEPSAPELSIVTAAWDQLAYTQAFVEAVRRSTDVPYELIVVDNGSDWRAANYAREAADVSILNGSNAGFARAMNQALEAASGRVVAFCNNDTVLPPGWASTLLPHLDDPRVGIVVPAVTKARHDRTVRAEPGASVETLAPFEPPPPAVVYLLRRETIQALGGWGEEYEIASGEDTDLAFKAWVNALEIVYDSRVLVQHVEKGTAKAKLPDWASLWRSNRHVFLTKWQDPLGRVPYAGLCSEEEFDVRLRIAGSVAWWMRRYFDGRDGRVDAHSPTQAISPRRRRLLLRALVAWHRMKPFVPTPVRTRLVTRFSGRW